MSFYDQAGKNLYFDDPRANMLPTGSYFIVAQATGGLEAGTPYKVLNSAPERGIVQIQRGGPSAVDVPVWVFPPPVERGSVLRFGRTSPVIGTIIRDLAPE